jgi:hypothetical protein
LDVVPEVGQVDERGLAKMAVGEGRDVAGQVDLRRGVGAGSAHSRSNGAPTAASAPTLPQATPSLAPTDVRCSNRRRRRNRLARVAFARNLVDALRFTSEVPPLW